MPDGSTPPSPPSWPLDPVAFRERLSAEVGRVRSTGGFLSLVVLGLGRIPGDDSRLTRAAHQLAARVGVRDVLGRTESSLAILMPDTTCGDAELAARELLGLVFRDIARGPQAVESAGLATTYGDVEGGAEALLAAAEEALQGAGPRRVATSPSLQGRPRVLVVDDNITFARALADSLAERGWEGHPCAQFQDACQRAEEGTYHALFIDLHLRGGSGLEVFRRALALNPRRPAVLMSGYDTDDELQHALKLGPAVFLRKPFSSAELDAALEMFRGLLPGTRHRRPKSP